MSKPKKNIGKGKSPSVNNKLSEDMVMIVIYVGKLN